MGCDIHFYVEARKDADSPWVTADHWEVDDIALGPEVPRRFEFYTGRHYALFSLLAGVRGDGHPLIEPRGVPEDACPEYRAAAANYGSDGHTHHWYTLAELEASAEAIRAVSPCFVNSTMMRMRHAAYELGGWKPENVRCCFYFDN